MTSPEPMITAGIDLASRANRTGSCRIEWLEKSATVTSLTSSFDDDQITDLIAGVTKLGIDVPLGWPLAFVEAITMHSADGSWPMDYIHSQNEAYRYRRTDLWTREVLGFPALLSVSTNLISIPAMRAVAVLSRLPNRAELDGSGVVVEVYPAGALHQWGFRSQGYKGKLRSSERLALVEEFIERTQHWLSLEQHHISLCISDDNAFDVLIAALVARASLLGRVVGIPRGLGEVARREGWIALPTTTSLQQLVS